MKAPNPEAMKTALVHAVAALAIMRNNRGPTSAQRGRAIAQGALQGIAEALDARDPTRDVLETIREVLKP